MSTVATDRTSPWHSTHLTRLKAAIGTQVGLSDWFEMSQERINTFADATGDHQWIHTDPERAAQGPFGTTIAHGYLTLSLLPVLSQARHDGQRACGWASTTA